MPQEVIPACGHQPVQLLPLTIGLIWLFIKQNKQYNYPFSFIYNATTISLYIVNISVCILYHFIIYLYFVAYFEIFFDILFILMSTLIFYFIYIFIFITCFHYCCTSISTLHGALEQRQFPPGINKVF